MGNLTSISNILEDKKSVTDTNFTKKYQLGAYIATGTFATVKHCTRISDKKQFAVKIVKKQECTENELLLLRDEINIYTSLNHPHIITLEDVYENSHIVEMVLELCNEQNLSHLTNASPHCRLPESDCSQIAQIIGNTLKYLHSKQIVHRDLKPENVLFTKDNILKITDFGSAFTTNNRSKYLNRTFSRLPSFRMDTMVGTPNYVAPEVLQGIDYSYRVDLWSLGVILFECIAGYHPFATRKTRKSIGKLYAAIISGKYKMESVWKTIDKDAMDLVTKLLIVDPNQRITIDQLLQHEFIIKYSENNRFCAKKNENSKDMMDDEKDDNVEIGKRKDMNEMDKSILSDATKSAVSSSYL